MSKDNLFGRNHISKITRIQNSGTAIAKGTEEIEHKAVGEVGKKDPENAEAILAKNLKGNKKAKSEKTLEPSDQFGREDSSDDNNDGDSVQPNN